MHNQDDMSSLCTEMVLGMTHKLNGTPKINITINGLNVQYWMEMHTCMEMTLLDRYCSPDHFGTSFVFFRLTMNKRRFKRLFKLDHFNHFENDIKGKIGFVLLY